MNRKDANAVIDEFEHLCRNGLRMGGFMGGYGYRGGFMGGYGYRGGGMMSGGYGYGSGGMMSGGGRMSYEDMMGIRKPKKGEFMGMNGLVAQLGLMTKIDVRVKKTNEILSIETYERKLTGIYFICNNGKKYHASKLEVYGGAEDEKEEVEDEFEEHEKDIKE